MQCRSSNIPSVFVYPWFVRIEALLREKKTAKTTDCGYEHMGLWVDKHGNMQAGHICAHNNTFVIFIII